MLVGISAPLVETVDALSNVLSEANKELLEIARRSNASVLRQRSYDGLSSEYWMSEVLNEMANRCPMVHKILCSLLECGIQPERKNPAMCLIYGIMLFLRCHELSRIQRLNSLFLMEGQASVNVSCVYCDVTLMLISIFSANEKSCAFSNTLTCSTVTFYSVIVYNTVCH